VTDIGSSDTKELQDEIMGEMAQALGNTAGKLQAAIAEAEQAKDTVLEIEQQLRGEQKRQQLEIGIAVYQEARAKAMRRRHNLLVHRQACGFKVNNHSTVYRYYPIPPKMTLSVSGTVEVSLLPFDVPCSQQF
jgi:hypothetical protein